ncbi:SDR family NAD(P)-dependent oxidoreductase [Devosia sp. Naph2]|uniref:SDR family NAD(P)-dependent oxidoreductase n=1 Tax=Devosia polycyclovorans TaxID=3345148 RepID=UPI0035CF8344
MTDLKSFPVGGLAVVIGANGGIGRALVEALSDGNQFGAVLGFSRRADGLDLTDEASIAKVAHRVHQHNIPIRLVIVATGLLHDDEGLQPEKSWRQLDAARLARSFAVNATGPALVAKHFLPLLPREGKAVFAALSAKVGSIGDNRLGGWYGYRAAKAALHQLIHTAAIELQRNRPDAFCVTLHPGTVATPLSAPFTASGHDPVTAEFAAARLLGVIDNLRAADNGRMLDHTGQPLPW